MSTKSKITMLLSGIFYGGLLLFGGGVQSADACDPNVIGDNQLIGCAYRFPTSKEESFELGTMIGTAPPGPKLEGGVLKYHAPLGGLLNFDIGTSDLSKASESQITTYAKDDFLIRWKGNFYFPKGDYIFKATADDGIAIFVNGSKVINAWNQEAINTPQTSKTVSLEKGERVSIEIQYREDKGASSAKVGWHSVCGGTLDAKREVEKNMFFGCVPSYDPYDPYLLPQPISAISGAVFDKAGTYTGFVSDFEKNGPFWRYLLGYGFVIRPSWNNSASPVLISEPVDNFTVNYGGRIEFDEGTYEFIARADDGVRVTVNNETLFDRFSSTGSFGSYTLSANKKMQAGTHAVSVDFAEEKGDAKVAVGWRKLGDLTAPMTPTTTTPATPTSDPAGTTTVTPGGRQMIEFKPPTSAKTLEELLQVIMRFMFYMAIALAPLFYVAAGFILVVGGGDPKKVQLAKDIFLWTTIGFVVILIAAGLEMVIRDVLGVRQ
ncbi:MAG: PA14 domain-containing protein [bacterium]|nr:PA14 domain-containing protein [bacterium]